jgi:hypothetical protein
MERTVFFCEVNELLPVVVHAEEERVADHDQESLGARDGNVEPINEFTNFWMKLFGINWIYLGEKPGLVVRAEGSRRKGRGIESRPHTKKKYLKTGCI